MADAPRQQREYALGHSTQELDRLAMQARLMEPFTRRVFEQAGLGAGMSVLDVGSGAGDVAFLVRQMVGPEGKVVGTDRAAEGSSGRTGGRRRWAIRMLRSCSAILLKCPSSKPSTPSQAALF